MIIVKPKTSDIPGLLTLWEGQYKLHHRLDKVYYAHNSSSLSKQFESYIKKAIKTDKPNILVAKGNNKLIGFITFSEESEPYFDSSIKKFGTVIELFVDENYRRRAVGKRLMDAAEEYFRQSGLKFIKIQCSSFNRVALDFYKNLNYTNCQTILLKKI